MNKKSKTLVSCIICPSCKDIIYSRARHDFRWCSCKEVAVDGGQDYFKVVFNKNIPKTVKKYVEASKKELYDDWDKGLNKFGIIKQVWIE